MQVASTPPSVLISAYSIKNSKLSMFLMVFRRRQCDRSLFYGHTLFCGVLRTGIVHCVQVSLLPDLETKMAHEHIERYKFNHKHQEGHHSTDPDQDKDVDQGNGECDISESD